jgi:hypothetical protein
MRRIFFSASLVSLFLFAAPARAAVTIVLQRGTAQPETLYIDGPHMRAENPEHGEHGSIVLIDATSKRVDMVDVNEKTYTEITEADRQRMHAQMEAMRAQMQERMKSMPPEQRAKMESMMGPGAGGKPHEWTFKATGAKKTINGFACQVYEVSEDGKVSEEECISPWSAGLIKKEDFAALAKFGQEMMEEVGGRAMRGGGGGILARLEKAPGIPISRIPISFDGSRGEEEQVKSIKRGSIPSSLFAVPAGFTKKELPMMGLGGRHHGPPQP